jgi:hypothetical protein
MTNEPTDAGETMQQHPLPRKTPIGRHFGSISYPREEEESSAEDPAQASFGEDPT